MTRFAAAGLLVLVPLVFGAGCVRAREETQAVAVHDRGTLCLGLGGDGGVAAVVEDEPLRVIVRSGCLADRCATGRSGSCGVKVDGTRVVVTSDLAWTAPVDVGSTACRGACSPIETLCATDVKLARGTYDVVYGEQHVALEVPSSFTSACAPTATGGPVAIASASPSVAVSAALAAPSASSASDAPPASAGVSPRVATPREAAPPDPVDVLCVAGPPAPKRPVRGAKPPKKTSATVTVTRANPCVGMSCVGALARCAARRGVNNTVMVDLTMPGRDARPRAPCTEACAPLVATCKVADLPSGTYTFELGNARKTVVLPGLGTRVCSSDGP